MVEWSGREVPRSVLVDDVARVLRETLGPWTKIIAHTPDNALIIGGSSEDIATVERLLTQHDRAAG